MAGIYAGSLGLQKSPDMLPRVRRQFHIGSNPPQVSEHAQHNQQRRPPMRKQAPNQLRCSRPALSGRPGFGSTSHSAPPPTFHDQVGHQQKDNL